MVKRFIISVALLIPVALIAQIDWTKQVKNIPSYVANALGDPGANGFVKRTAANTSTVAGATDVWPGTVPLASVSGNTGAWPGTIPFGSVTGTSTSAWPGTVPFGSVTGTSTSAWPGTMPYSSLTSVPNHLLDPGANGVVYRNALNTTAPATGAQLPLMVASGASASAGAVPSPSTTAGTSHYLREDATWVQPQVNTQLVATGARALNGTAIQNTSGRPFFVSVWVTFSTGSTSASAYTDSTTNPTTQVAGVYAGSTTYTMSMFFIVLPGNYYKVTASTGVSLSGWVEWN